MASWEKVKERGQKDERIRHIHPMCKYTSYTEDVGRKKTEQVSSIQLFLLWKCNFFRVKTLIYTDFCSVYLFVRDSETQLK